MKKILPLLLFGLLLSCSVALAQKKLLSEINSIHTREVVTFKYNSKNQLVYFDEKGTVTYTEYTLKYDKSTNKLSECTMNQDKGELVQNSKYLYIGDGFIIEEIKSSGKKILSKSVDQDTIHIDSKERLTKTMFEDGKIWEEFGYDANDNLIKYKMHSAFGNSDKITEYKFDSNNSIFSNLSDFPVWFWALHMNKMRWCGEFIGKNNALENVTDDPKYGIGTVEITYDYDSDGYPLKQYYDGDLVKEFKYKTAK